MKKIIIIVSIVCVIGLGLGILYAVDMDRMKNNRPVIFSTWGYEYTVPEQDTPLKAFERIEVGTKRSEILNSFGKPDGELFGMRGDIYNTDGKRIIIYYDGGSITDATVMNVRIDDYNVSIDKDKFDGTELDQTQNETGMYSYEKIELSVVTSNEKNKRKILNVSELDTYVGSTFNSNYDLYYYGLDEVNIVIDTHTSSLETALREGKTTLEDVIKKARFDCLKYLTDSSIESKLLSRLSSYDDGGTTEYMYENYTIIKMNTLDGDRDVYIGTTDMTLSKINEYKSEGK